MTRIFLLLCLPMMAALPVTAQQEDSVRVENLDEVVVYAGKPQIKGDNGSLVVDLPSIVADKPVTNILESLAYLPGVISQDGAIGLAGTSQTTIVLNGEVQQISQQQLYELLYSLPVSRLENVEITYSAPARYHTSGAVINVVLKQPSPLDGLQGQARAGYNQGHYGSYGGGLSAVYATGGWTFDMNYSASQSNSWSSEDMVSRHTLPDGLHVVEESNRRKSSSLSHLLYGAVGYRFKDESTLKATYHGNIVSNAEVDNRSAGTFGSFLNRSLYPSPQSLNNISLSYKSSFGLSLSADYARYYEHRLQRMNNTGTDELLVDASNRQQVNRYRLVADMEHDISGWKLGYGAEYRLSDDYSRMDYIMPEMPGFNNTLTEHSVEAYISLQHTLACGLSFQASAGEALYRVAGRNNWTFQPQMSLTYGRNPSHILQASFTTDRTYPSYWTLHGGKGYLNPYSEVWGNPELMPSTTYMAQVSYIFRQRYVATLFFNDVEDDFAQLPYQSADELKLVFQERNFDFNRKVGINITAPFYAGSWFDTRVTAQGFYNTIRADHFHDMSFRRSKFTAFGSVQNTFRVCKGLSFTLDASAISGSLQGIADLSALWRIDAGAKWTFGRDSSFELSLKADDIFNTWSPKMSIRYGRQDYTMQVNDMTRNVKLTFIYRFNGFKQKNEEIDSSRFGIK